MIATNVLYLMNHAGKGGTERYVLNLAGSLNHNKINAFLAYNERGALVDKLEALGVKTCRLPMRSRFDLGAAARLAGLCGELKIDLIHTQFLRENYIALLSRLFNPRVKVIYTNHIILENDLFTRITNKLLKPLEAGVIAVCERGRATLEANGFKGPKIRVVPNAVDTGYWYASGESSMRREFGIDEEAFVMTCVARFSPEKGHRFLVASLARLKEITGGGFKCLLAGDGPLLDETRKYAESLGLGEEIIFAGFREDVRNLLRGSDLFLNPSQNEASSFGIIEAIACGVPVIATDVGGNSDIVNEENNCGLLVRYNDIEDMAGAMKRLMGDAALRGGLSRNARKAAEEKFSLVKMAEQTYNLYNEFTSGGRNK